MATAKFITSCKDGSIAHFEFMYRCYCYCCHSSDTPIVKKKAKELSLRVESITPFQAIQKNKEETLRQGNELLFKDIESDLEHTFKGQYITFREEWQFTEYYTELFHEVSGFLKRLETFHVEPSETIAKFASDFENLQWFIKSHNDNYIKEELDTYKDFSTIA